MIVNPVSSKTILNLGEGQEGDQQRREVTSVIPH